MAEGRGFPWRFFWIYVLVVIVTIVLCVGVLTNDDEKSGGADKTGAWGGEYVHSCTVNC